MELFSIKIRCTFQLVSTIGRYGSWTYCSIEDNILEAKEVALGI